MPKTESFMNDKIYKLLYITEEIRKDVELL